MGTRHLIDVVCDNQTKVSQYGQWDGYPSGQGRDICDFIKNEMNYDLFKDQVRKLQFITDEEYKRWWVECGADPDSNFVNMEVAAKHANLYPHLDRDCGSNILGLIQDGKVDLVQNSSSFKDDGLFCEFRYVLDLDRRVLECYTGGTSKFAEYPFDYIKEKRPDDMADEMDKILEMEEE